MTDKIVLTVTRKFTNVLHRIVSRRPKFLDFVGERFEESVRQIDELIPNLQRFLNFGSNVGIGTHVVRPQWNVCRNVP
jgi:hypothetical protein